jgi:hypothetical protein
MALTPPKLIAADYCEQLYQVETRHLWDWLRDCYATGESPADCKQEEVAVNLATMAAEDFYQCKSFIPSQGYPPPQLPSGGSGIVTVTCHWYNTGTEMQLLGCDVSSSRKPELLPPSTSNKQTLDCSLPKDPLFDHTMLRRRRT